jgi:release factor glutamine methyltransferase
VVKQPFSSHHPERTVLQVLRDGEAALGQTSSSPRLDSEVLLRHVLNVSQSGLIVAFPEPCPADAQVQFSEVLERRKRGEPIAYIVGEREFWGLSFHVTPDVLVPRPETELLIEEVAKDCGRRQSVHVLDLGTGSGCIAIALVKELLLRGCAQISCDVGAHICFVQGSWCRDTTQLRPPYDYIVANPPYIDSLEKTPIELTYEPPSALYSNAHGLADAAEILCSGLPLLKPGGVLLCEVGAGKGPFIEGVMGQYRGDYKVEYMGDSSELDRFRVVKVARISQGCL